MRLRRKKLAASVELTRQSEQLDELVGDVGTVLNGNKKAV